MSLGETCVTLATCPITINLSQQPYSPSALKEKNKEIREKWRRQNLHLRGLAGLPTSLEVWLCFVFLGGFCSMTSSIASCPVPQLYNQKLLFDELTQLLFNTRDTKYLACMLSLPLIWKINNSTIFSKLICSHIVLLNIGAILGIYAIYISKICTRIFISTLFGTALTMNYQIFINSRLNTNVQYFYTMSQYLAMRMNTLQLHWTI